MDNSGLMTRRDFIKKISLTTAAVAFFGKSSILCADAVSDNLDANRFQVGSSPPSSKKVHWIDTSTGKRIHKYWDASTGTWKPVTAVWG